MDPSANSTLSRSYSDGNSPITGGLPAKLLLRLAAYRKARTMHPPCRATQTTISILPLLMQQFLAITRNTYLQSVRQPAYGIIIIVTLAGLGLAPAMTGWTLDDDNKLLRDIGLSTLLVQGLFLACFCATSVLDAEIEEKTALTVAAKPVGRSMFILGKYAGILGALLTAHYIAGIGLFMAMRHGVLQSAAEKPDYTVILFGPCMMLLVVLAATLMNYVYEWRFLPTVVGFSLPALTFSTIVLLFLSRDFTLQTYETTQDIRALPAEVADNKVFNGIIYFRPDPGSDVLPGHPGKLVRSNWLGPINDEERAYLLGLVDDIDWRRSVGYLIRETRKLAGFEILKAGVLILIAIAFLGSVAVAAATRTGVVPTFAVTLVVVCLGLSSDQVIKPAADAGSAVAQVAYRVVPTLQAFWMVDALNENRVIPIDYIGHAALYLMFYTAAALLLAMALYQTREVG